MPNLVYVHGRSLNQLSLQLIVITTMYKMERSHFSIRVRLRVSANTLTYFTSWTRGKIKTCHSLQEKVRIDGPNKTKSAWLMHIGLAYTHTHK